MLWTNEIETGNQIEITPTYQTSSDTELAYSTLAAEQLDYVKTMCEFLLCWE